MFKLFLLSRFSKNKNGQDGKIGVFKGIFLLFAVVMSICTLIPIPFLLTDLTLKRAAKRADYKAPVRVAAGLLFLSMMWLILSIGMDNVKMENHFIIALVLILLSYFAINTASNPELDAKTTIISYRVFSYVMYTGSVVFEFHNIPAIICTLGVGLLDAMAFYVVIESLKCNTFSMSFLKNTIIQYLKLLRDIPKAKSLW